MKITTFLMLIVILFTALSCKTDKTNSKQLIKNMDSIKLHDNPSAAIYRKWLNDTLLVLKNKNINEKHIQSYTVNNDSTSLNIKTITNKTFLNISTDSKLYSGDIQYAITLLKSNHIMPISKFQLIIVTDKYYDQPFKDVGLKYDFQIDVLNFYVITDGIIKQYQFMKGNLTDSSIIKKMPNIQHF